MNGRIEVYMHSDSVTEHKGAAFVRVLTDTDFAARTDEFKTFASDCAKYAYGALLDVDCAYLSGPSVWKQIVEKFPHLDEQRKLLERELRERISVTEVAILKL